MKLKGLIICGLLWVVSFPIFAGSNDIVAYVGGSGNEVFNDVIQISDGSFLICGGADDLDWVKIDAARKVEMQELAGLQNSNGSSRYAFILRVSKDFSRILNLVYLPRGAAEDFRFIKTTNIPGEPTGDIYLSGNIKHTGIFSNNERPVTVFIARLNNNFVRGIPTGFVWQHSYWSEGYVADYHPWDVRNDGKVVVAEGQSHNQDFGAIYMLDSQTGEYTIVPKWRNHRYKFHRLMNTTKQRDDFIEGDFWGMADQHVPNPTRVKAYQRDANFEVVRDNNGNPIVLEEGDSIGPILYSRIYTKWNGSADLRSWTQEDFDLWQVDENGSYKKGKYPWDMLFSTPCNPNDIAGSTKQNEEGYTRYRTQGGSKAVYGTSSITIDRRNNDCYIGMNVSSKLPDGGLPDFEPVVIAYDAEGVMKWWSRLYHETVNGVAVTEDGKLKVTGYTPNTSTPDQYVDAIAIDYSRPTDEGEILVNARCHGNNVENLWEGNTIAVNPSANGFKNGYSGTGGDMHLGWLGRMKANSGQLLASTYVAEAADDAEFGSSVLQDPNMDGWHNPNDGWLKLTTTRCVNNTLKVSADGYPVIISSGRRTITTANANQKMWKPEEGKSCWNMFVRVYNPSLSLPLYSSLASGTFGPDGQGGDNTTLTSVWKTDDGVITIGRSKVNSDGTPSGNPINLSNVPAWGKSTQEKEDAVLFYFKVDNIANDADGYEEISGLEANRESLPKLMIDDNYLKVTVGLSGVPVYVYDMLGICRAMGEAESFIDISSLPRGTYMVLCNNKAIKFCK